MGLDMYVEAHRGDESVELVYFRKNWNLRNYMKFKDDDVCTYPGLRLEKEDLKKMIDYCAYNPDYWYDWEPLDYDGNPRSPEEMSGYIEEANGFKKIGQLCYLLSMYDDWMKAGYQLFYVASW